MMEIPVPVPQPSEVWGNPLKPTTWRLICNATDERVHYIAMGVLTYFTEDRSSWAEFV